MATDNPTARIEMTARELSLIYEAVNAYCCEMSSKSKSLHSADPLETVCNPDLYQRTWEELGRINHRIYQAEKRLAGRR